MARQRKSIHHAVTSNADQMERDAMRGAPVPLDDGPYDERLASIVSEAAGIPEGDEPAWQREDWASDSVVATDVAELLRRRTLLRDAYPFQIERDVLTYRGSSNLIYEFCLCTSLAQNLSKGRLAEIPRAFERLAGRLAAAYLGPGGRWYRLGWPPFRDRPKTLREAVQRLRDETGEWLWNPLPAFAKHSGPKNVKDGGIDLVIWQPFGDGRVGQLFLLGQCACGNDWPTKTRDLAPRAFEGKWLRIMSHCDVVRFMAIPHHVSAENDWAEACVEGGIVFDRVRLTMLGERAFKQDPEFSKVRGDLHRLIRLVQPKFVDVNSAGA